MTDECMSGAAAKIKTRNAMLSRQPVLLYRMVVLDIIASSCVTDGNVEYDVGRRTIPSP